MSLYQRNGTWWLRFTVDGCRYRESTDTSDKTAAQEYHDRRKAELWQEVRLGRRPRMSWREAAVRWIEEKKSEKRSISDDKSKIRALDPFFGKIYLDQIERRNVQNAVEQDGRSNATRNRYVALIRSILNRAQREWEVLDRVPKLPKYQENDGRLRFLTREEADRLVMELPAHLAAMAEFTLQTGLRSENVLGLDWNFVYLAAGKNTIHLPASVMKGGRDLTVPLSKVAVGILQTKTGDHNRWVFTYSPPLKNGVVGESKRIGQVKTSTFQAACERAGIHDFRWHDLRHTWASWHIMNGTSLRELMELGGWSEYRMVLRYAHLADSHLSKTVENIPGPATTRA